MRVSINNTPYTLPSTLYDITLGQRIKFQAQHGDLLDKMHQSILEMEDEMDREMEMTEFQFESMFRALSFFTGIDIQVLKECEFLDTLVHVYAGSIGLLAQQEKDLENSPEFEFTWNKEEWVLHTPELKHGDKMSFGEFIDAKQIMQDMKNLSKNRYECLLPLCAIYLRRRGEDYQESFLYDDSERLKLMQDLPLHIALQVGFFLTSSLNMCMDISQSSELPVSSLQEST